MRERMMNWRSRQVKTIIFSVILLVSLFLWNGVRYHDTKTKSLQGDTRERRMKYYALLPLLRFHAMPPPPPSFLLLSLVVL